MELAQKLGVYAVYNSRRVMQAQVGLDHRNEWTDRAPHIV